MRINTLIGTSIVVGALAASTLTVRAAPGSRKAALFNFLRPTLVAGAIVRGPTVIVHDDEKMARGEACTTVYRYDRKAPRGEGDEVVSFHCKPTPRPIATKAQVHTERFTSGFDELLEYQLVGETEGHGVPQR